MTEDHPLLLPLTNQVEVIPPEVYVVSSQQHTPISTAPVVRATKKLERVHSDVCGLMQTPSKGGAWFFTTFTDDFTCYTWVYFLQKKNDFLSAFLQWEKIVTQESGCNISALRSDNGGEYISKALEFALADRGIRHEKTAPHTPEQNGVAKHKNRTLVESARCMLLHAGLDDFF